MSHKKEHKICAYLNGPNRGEGYRLGAFKCENKGVYNEVNDRCLSHEKRAQDVPLSSVWCGRWDLNPYGLPYAPQTYASAYSATTALSTGTRKLYYHTRLLFATVFPYFFSQCSPFGLFSLRRGYYGGGEALSLRFSTGRRAGFCLFYPVRILRRIRYKVSVGTNR